MRCVFPILYGRPDNRHYTGATDERGYFLSCELIFDVAYLSLYEKGGFKYIAALHLDPFASTILKQAIALICTVVSDRPRTIS
jgi:hypothetical protein